MWLGPTGEQSKTGFVEVDLANWPTSLLLITNIKLPVSMTTILSTKQAGRVQREFTRIFCMAYFM
jgi:hypothetical protein